MVSGLGNLTMKLLALVLALTVLVPTGTYDTDTGPDSGTGLT